MPRNNRTPLIAACVLLLLPTGVVAAAEKKPDPAKLSVSGLGFFGNREQRLALERMLGEERGPVIGPTTVEDAAFMIVSALAGEGYLKPVVTVNATTTDGQRRVFTFDASLVTLLPRELEVTAVRFEVDEGVRSVVHDVTITGVTALKPVVARGFFRPNEVPLVGTEARAYSPARLRRSTDALAETLRQSGYADATVKAVVTRNDERTGRVDVAVTVVEGPRWMVTAAQLEGAEDTGVTLAPTVLRLNQPWSRNWQQDTSEQVRRTFYREGYADMLVDVIPTVAEPYDGRREVSVAVRVSPGPSVKLAHVRFEGNKHTRESILRRRVRAREGEPLDPLALERSRFRLARLGSFETVDLHYDPATGTQRDAVFTVREMPRWDASLLAGYGSYEQLRGGVELQQTNLLGRAHQSRLVLVQSVKSTRGEYTYTVPELFGESIDGTARVFGLRREEESFDREEYGGTVGVRRRIPWLKAEGSLGYTYQSLSNQDNELTTSAVDADNVKVASIDVGLTKDRRDNPLRPRRGYRWFAQAEFASETLGGEVDYQLFEAGAAYHTAWGRSRWIHLGLTHGAITQWGAPDGQLIPVNKRFYPGGDSSIRGFQKDEAAPRGPDGRFIGAETYTLFNLEIEQAITKTWSVVVFGDALGEAATLGDYPWDEQLYSVGLGIRYQTIVGPVRLEYGRNVNPRPGDPSGTLHFSVGFPF
ncbi:BamA/OMP85 family outer membrane protein [Rariglobus hedericola]|uniref:BamA/TamA family outer membrane protein n=1 Tax=Rariglobus hedericola TaxID=2597822 RepID=A0A556QP99_9BACT|nr:BamA/TamA family outer membrane protein [Rariglobus hedericola]TSJ78465.1 BamA/TamA family outer membrane protein [Rariglobus hedericola]